MYCRPCTNLAMSNFVVLHYVLQNTSESAVLTAFLLSPLQVYGDFVIIVSFKLKHFKCATIKACMEYSPIGVETNHSASPE